MDTLPLLVRAFLNDESTGAPLRQEVARGVASATQSYPDAYFNLGRRTPEAVDDLINRVFTVCARVPKGRYPFLNRVPFRAYVDENMTGQNIRYHTFYAKISITREILRTDYEHNLVRDPRLRWRAELFDQVHAALKAHGRLVSDGSGGPPRYAAPGPALTLVRRQDAVVDDLARSGLREVPELVARALRQTGPTTASRMCALIGEVLCPEQDAEDDAREAAEPATQGNVSLRLSVRDAVLRAWRELTDEERGLMTALARGDSYDEVMAREPRLRNRVAVTRAVERCNRTFLARLFEATGAQATGGAAPKEILELLFEVLVEALPELRPVEGRSA